uniref:Photosystem I assembly protein Ycf4 n=1 Tax=Bornetia secundiflora TaxID=2575637 RepID=A0A4D6WM10_9FLOR|nr:photosystem I assembly protein Ycf4 [Bornetia secundiflora]
MQQVKIDHIIGSRRFSNYWWATIIFFGSLGFFLAGLSSYLDKQLLPFSNTHDIIFLPQGIIMTFYGTLGMIISVFLWYTIILNVGSGYNKFDKDKGIVTIFRLGFPGPNRILKLTYYTKDIHSIKININDGLSPKREICLKTKDKRQIPITKVGQPISFHELELQASNLAKFLGVMIEGLDG